jgi:drug/metabolite transporter (DMT)-like permease
MSRKPFWVLALSLVGISFAGPLVRLSRADPIAIAIWRLGFSLVIVAAFLVATREWRDWRRLSRGELGLALIAGLSLALHFWAWNASIHLTTIAASVTLVNLQPIIVAAISAITLKEAPDRRQMAGILVAIVGAVVITSPELRAGFTRGNAPLVGNALATSAAVTAAIYYTIGRRLRRILGVWSYVAIVYATAVLVLAAIAVTLGLRLWPQPQREIAIFAGLALGPMLLGHTGMNWALKFLPAYVVNLTVLGEPVGATLLGALIPSIRQIPSVSTLVGGAIVLGGVIVAANAAAARNFPRPYR